MLSSQDKANIYKTVYSSNMRQLSRKYNNCKNTCALPIQCTFGIKPIYFYIVGNYQQSSNDKYNTILTFTENLTTYLFITLKVFVEVVPKDDPTDISTQTITQPPGVYESPAETFDIIIKSYFNVPNC